MSGQEGKKLLVPLQLSTHTSVVGECTYVQLSTAYMSVSMLLLSYPCCYCRIHVVIVVSMLLLSYPCCYCRIHIEQWSDIV